MLAIDHGELILEPGLCMRGLALQTGQLLLESGYEGGDEFRRQKPVLQSGQDTGFYGLAVDRDVVGAGGFRTRVGATVAILS
jgi:hypothetical protein